MTKNIFEYPRNGYRARPLSTTASQCNGAEWSRRKNLAYFGKLDLGGDYEG